MSLFTLLRARRDEILRIAARYGASNIRIFGSVARGEDGPESDIDLLIDLEPGRTLFDLGGMISDLQDILDRRVDLVTENGISRYIRRKVLSEAVPL